MTSPTVKLPEASCNAYEFYFCPNVARSVASQKVRFTNQEITYVSHGYEFLRSFTAPGQREPWVINLIKDLKVKEVIRLSLSQSWQSSPSYSVEITQKQLHDLKGRSKEIEISLGEEKNASLKVKPITVCSSSTCGLVVKVATPIICEKCNTTTYCSTACLNSDKEKHQDECTGKEWSELSQSITDERKQPSV